MKRTTLSILIMCFMGSAGFAQSLSLTFGDMIVSNDTVYLTGDISDELIEWHLKVKNLTDKDIDVKVKKNEIYLLENTVNTFCWGSCFMPTVYTSPVSVKIQAFTTDVLSFAGDFEPYGMFGTSIISYTFFNTQNQEDSVMVTAFYQVGTSGISSQGLNNELLKVYPNPFVDRLNIEFQNSIESPYSIRLLNLNGQVVKELVSNSRSKEQSFYVGNLPGTIFFLKIIDSKGLIHRRKLLKGK